MFTSPVKLQEDILEEVFRYAKKITGHPGLRKTFALNSLVAIDNAKKWNHSTRYPKLPGEKSITGFLNLIHLFTTKAEEFLSIQCTIQN